MAIRKVAVNTGGGDAPGLNAVLRAVTLSALRLGWEIVGIRDGYLGLLDAQRTLYGAQQGLVAARLAEQANRVALYKALGGGWKEAAK